MPVVGLESKVSTNMTGGLAVLEAITENINTSGNWQNFTFTTCEWFLVRFYDACWRLLRSQMCYIPSWVLFQFNATLRIKHAKSHFPETRLLVQLDTKDKKRDENCHINILPKYYQWLEYVVEIFSWCRDLEKVYILLHNALDEGRGEFRVETPLSASH